jgi:hypothetical protein
MMPSGSGICFGLIVGQYYYSGDRGALMAGLGRTFWRTACASAVLGMLLGAQAPSDDADATIAASLAQMLRSARAVISANQALINDPEKSDKGLTGQVVLAQTIKLYQSATKTDPTTIDPKSREGRLLHYQMDAIVEVVDANQTTVNEKGVGFKAFIPAVFARLVNEAFARRAGDEASVKVTAPLDLVRNRKALPDKWEKQVIESKFLGPGWPMGHPFEAVVDENGHKVFRMMAPEYYVASCLSCHGDPKGALDITGYPREGGKEGDLGGVISVTLSH